MHRYSYNGPVMVFNRCVANNWKGTTYAESEKKAKNNLAYQFKQNNNQVPGTKVRLPGEVTLVE